jgi:hypothetical protein
VHCVDPTNPNDLKEVHALQDAVKLSQPGDPGRFEMPNWDPVSQKKVRDALIVRGCGCPGYQTHVCLSVKTGSDGRMVRMTRLTPNRITGWRAN